MVRAPPGSTWTYTLFPCTTRFRSGRIVADIGISDDARARFQTMFIGIILRRQQQGRRAIDDARRIAGMVEMLDFKVGVAAVDLLPESEATAHVEVGETRKARLQRGQALGGRERKSVVLGKSGSVRVDPGWGTV